MFRKGLLLLLVSGTLLLPGHTRGTRPPEGAALVPGRAMERLSCGVLASATADARRKAPCLVDAAEDLEKRLDRLKKRWNEFTEDLRQSEEYRKLQEELRGLYEDLRKAEETAREKLEKDVIPKLKRELEKLKDKLRGLDREEEEDNPPVPI